ncbi:response regulator of RpoS [Raoultella terrigena]|uniref:Response regulator of RpoS n=2 Tax=Raoultella terrigena TaxID=577 RepID=A0A3P8KYY3_RAOTE|nr:response regulator of RpoS [Raoultella terrigena]
MYNIVIVEDEYIESESLKRIISRCVENSVIHEAATGRKAIQLIDQLGQIDMMFVDINIPLPNGNQVIEYLKQKNTQTKVIVTTANDDFEIVRHMLSLKVDDYLLKP